MKNIKIRKIIEEVCDEVIKEQNVPRRDLALLYVKAIKRKNPALYKLLLSQALFAIKSVRADIKPRETVNTIHKLLRSDPDADPRRSGDTHGVRLFIDFLIADTKMAGKIKRFYQQSIDSLLKATYEQK